MQKFFNYEIVPASAANSLVPCTVLYSSASVLQCSSVLQCTLYTEGPVLFKCSVVAQTGIEAVVARSHEQCASFSSSVNFPPSKYLRKVLEVKVLLDWLYMKTLIYNFVWKVFEAHNIKVSYLKIIVHVNLWKNHFKWMEYILIKLDSIMVTRVNCEYLLRSFFSILAVFLRLRSRPVGTIFYRGFTREY